MATEPSLGPINSSAYAVGLAEMLADSPIGFAYLDHDYRYQSLNRAIADFHGFPIEAHMGQSMSVIIGKSAFEAVEPLLHSVLHEGKPFETPIDGRMLATRHQRKQAVVYGYPVRNDVHEIIGIGLFAVDTTNLEAAESRRQQVDSSLQIALDAAGMGLWRSDGSIENMYLSRTATQLMGLSADLPLTNALLNEVIDRNTLDEFGLALTEVMDNDTVLEQEFRVVWPDRTVHWLLAHGQVQNDDSRREIVGVLSDITERHTSEVEHARNSARQARAGEQAVRMQRVTAALSQAATVSQVCEVLLGEGATAIGAPRRIVALLNENNSAIESMQYEGYGDTTPALTKQRLDDDYPIPHTLRTGETTLLSSRQEMIARFPAFEEILQTSVSSACAVFPLIANERILGAWSLVFPQNREFEEGELIIMLTLAAQGAQAIERAKLYERERAISNSLQRTLLPQGLPKVSGLEAATRYRPGTPGAKVGGDWYDVIRLSSNRVALIIGDVGGHNIDSASTMGQLRNAIRSYAWENHPAGRILELTNRLLCGLEPGKLATCCYVELNLDDGIATLATAGHPPPLVMDPERGSYFVQLPPGTPLGTNPEQEYKQSTLFMSPHTSLALYTDGLVESRTLGLMQGMQGLSAAADENRMMKPEQLADALMKANAEQLNDDDMALLVANFQPVKPQQSSEPDRRSIHRYLPSSAASAGVARRFAADVMADWGVRELVDQVELCVSELVTNALIHTAADVELVLRLSSSAVRVEIIDHSDRMPVMRASSDEETSGRGLFIVDAVASAWGVEPAASGKSVWFQIQRNTGEITHEASSN